MKMIYLSNWKSVPIPTQLFRLNKLTTQIFLPIFLIGLFSQIGFGQTCIPSITCEDDSEFECNENFNLDNWLSGDSYTVEDCNMPLKVEHDYDPDNFMGCGGSGSQEVTFILYAPDITPGVNGQELDRCSRTLTINPPPMAVPTISILFEQSISCVEADNFMPPVLPYSNGIMGGPCEISGIIEPKVTEDWTKCGGTITVLYEKDIECDKTIKVGPFYIDVEKAPEATVTAPDFPSPISCVMADAFYAPNATYTNGISGTCKISGELEATVVEDWTNCGGKITVLYHGYDECQRELNAGPYVITVLPAPAPMLDVPSYPSSISCAESIDLATPYAYYYNGLTGNCRISGLLAPDVHKYVDKCYGGYIEIKYNGYDECGNHLYAPPIHIDVEPAAKPHLQYDLPMMINCWEAPDWKAPYAYYDNGEPGICNNSGYLYPEVMNMWDNCEGGNIWVRYYGYDDCYNDLSTGWISVMVMPDEIAPIGECKDYGETLQFIYQTPGPDDLDDYKYQIASNYWDYCSGVVVTLVGDSGYPVCQLDGSFERVYMMEVADQCGNVADTCRLTFNGACNPNYCTLSQSFYKGDIYPDSLFGYSSLEIIDLLIGYGEDSILIGGGDCGFYLDDAECIQTILSSGAIHTSYPINPGYWLNCHAELKNALISQIITTTLNIRYNALLNPNGPLDFGNYQLSAICQNLPYEINQAMPANATINDLLAYANDFLACQCDGTCGDYADFINDELTGVLLALNSRFHNCHVPGPCTIVDDCYVVDEKLLDIFVDGKGFRTDINWVMTDDIDVVRYELERSTDGINFTTVTKVLADQAETAKHYDATDEEPVEGVNIYRLKVCNSSGGHCYTPHRQVMFEQDFDEVNLYPNPTNNRINLTVHDYVGKPGVLEIVNNHGMKVGERVYQSIPENVLQFDVQDYVSGMYWLTLKVEGHKLITKKFIVNKLDFKPIGN